MQSEVASGINRVAFSAALRTLAHLGLAREEGCALVMHSLTFDILRELRGAAIHDAEQRFLWFLLSNGVQEYTEDERDGRYWAWLLKRELVATADVMPGFQYVLCVDRNTLVGCAAGWS